MAVPQKIKRRIIWFGSSISRYIGKGIENRDSYLYTILHSSFILNSQKVEATQVSIDGWMDKKNVEYTYNEYYSALKREGNSDTSDHMDVPWRMY